MENALVSYQFDEAPVRVVMILDNPWFVANDIAKVLGYQRAPDMVRHLDEDEKGVHVLHTLGGNQEMTVISESGLYAAIFKSRRPEAQRFRKWVTSEVLPELRRTGRYHLEGYTAPAPVTDEYDPNRLNACVATVREARRLYGLKGARQIWLDLGLPVPIAAARGDYDEALGPPLKQWLGSNAEGGFTTAEAIHGIGLDGGDQTLRNRLTALLRLLGWWSKRARRGQDLVHAWFPPSLLRGEA